MASYEELAVAMFGVAPGGYDSTLQNYFDSNGEIAYADWMIGLLHAVDGTSVSTSSALANVITTNLLGTNTVSAANQQWVTNYIATELNAGVDAGKLVDSLINILDGISASDPNWGAAHSEFSNKALAADYYDNIGGSATNLATLTGVLSGVGTTTGSVVSKEDALTTSGATGVDTYAVANDSSAVIDHSTATHNIVWAEYSNQYVGGHYVDGVVVGVTFNSYGETSYDFLATGIYPGSIGVRQAHDGTIILGYTNAEVFYSPGASSFNEVSINSGKYGDHFNYWYQYQNGVVLGGAETSFANASSDGYIVATDNSGNILHEVRIEDTSSPTSNTSISSIGHLQNGDTLAQLNSSDSYMVLDSNMQITETFSFSNNGTISNDISRASLIQNADGTYIALVNNNYSSNGTIDLLDSNFNVTASVGLELQGKSYFQAIYGITEGNGHLYVIAEANNHEVICELSGTGAGSTIVSSYDITANGNYINFARGAHTFRYDNGLIYIQQAYSTNTMLSFNPDFGVTANPSGTYKINTENLSGSLVADTNPNDSIATIVSHGGGTYQVHADVHLVGTTTGTAYAMSTTGLFTHGSMGTIA